MLMMSDNIIDCDGQSHLVRRVVYTLEVAGYDLHEFIQEILKTQPKPKKRRRTPGKFGYVLDHLKSLTQEQCIQHLVKAGILTKGLKLARKYRSKKGTRKC